LIELFTLTLNQRLGKEATDASRRLTAAAASPPPPPCAAVNVWHVHP
jgi:hypothetical protein